MLGNIREAKTRLQFSSLFHVVHLIFPSCSVISVWFLLTKLTTGSKLVLGILESSDYICSFVLGIFNFISVVFLNLNSDYIVW